MRKRLFIALPLTSGLRKKILYLEKSINGNINWIPIKNLHLTILFLGNIDINDLTKIFYILDNIKNKYKEDFRKIKTKITKIDYGPPGKKRMIWLYLEKNKFLDNIKKIFEDELTQNNIYFQREERNFLPHINLARLKKDTKKDIKKDLNWNIIFTEINLYESLLKKPFAEYEILKNITLI